MKRTKEDALARGCGYAIGRIGCIVVLAAVATAVSVLVLRLMEVL